MPEMLLLNKGWRKLLISAAYQTKIIGLALDEAHTIKKWYVSACMIMNEFLITSNFNWGSTFRESLAKIGELRSLLPGKNTSYGINSNC